MKPHDYFYLLLTKLLVNDLEEVFIVRMDATVKQLHKLLPNQSDLSLNNVWITYEGDFGSSLQLAFARCQQLLMLKEHGKTFHLNISISNDQLLHTALLKNVDRTFTYLGLTDDPLVSLVSTGTPLATIQFKAKSFLAKTHRTYTAGLNDQQAMKLLYQMDGMTGKVLPFNLAENVLVIDDAEQPDEEMEQVARNIRLCQGRDIRLFNGLAGIKRSPEQALRFLTQHIGSTFDVLYMPTSGDKDLDVALAAHLRGIKAEKLYGGQYEKTVLGYVRARIILLQQEGVPDIFIEKMKEEYENPKNVKTLRSRLHKYVQHHYQVNEMQLACMLYSPFINQGERLHWFLENEFPYYLLSRRNLSGSYYDMEKLIAIINSLYSNWKISAGCR